MADLMTGTSEWASGTTDTTSTLQNAVDEKRAEHINGPAAFIVALQAKLGAAASLVGSKTDLATRLAVSVKPDGRLYDVDVGDYCISARSSKTGWLLCDGAAYSRSTYSDLYSIIGTTYGAGDGSTTFNVPNWCGRVPVGSGSGVGGGASGTGAISGGTALTSRSVGQWFGEESHLNTAAESGLRAHDHTFTATTANSGQARAAHGGDAADSTFSTSSVSDLPALSAHNNIQPSLVVNVFIKY